MALSDPDVVDRQYASERDLEIRSRVFCGADSGDDPQELLFRAVCESPRSDLIEAGCGTGELAARLAAAGFAVTAVDRSPRMAGLAAARSLNALRADVTALPFPDGRFSVAVAAWMLYHVPDPDGALAELARVLRPGGRLVVAAPMLDNLHELWALVGAPPRQLTFSGETAAGLVRRRFRRAEVRLSEGRVVLRDAGEVRRFIGATIERRHFAERVPELRRPLAVRVRHAIITGRDPR